MLINNHGMRQLPILPCHFQHAEIYVVGKNCATLKVVNLKALACLSRDRLHEKINKWSENHRFVVVTRAIDGTKQVHAKSKMVDRLGGNKELVLNGQHLSVTVMSDEDYDAIEFKESLLREVKEIQSSLKSSNQVNSNGVISSFLKSMTSSKVLTHLIVGSVVNKKSELMRYLSEKYNEAAAKERKCAEAHEKNHRILVNEIEKQELRQEAVKKEIKSVF